MDRMCVIMVGHSGVGKSSCIRQHYPNAAVVSADHYFNTKAYALRKTYTEVWNRFELPRAHKDCQELFLELIRAGHPCVVVDNTNLRSRDRKLYMAMARTFGYRVILVIAPNCPEIGAANNIHGLTLEDIERQVRQQKLPAGLYEYTDTTRYIGPLPADYFPHIPRVQEPVLASV